MDIRSFFGKPKSTAAPKKATETAKEAPPKPSASTAAKRQTIDDDEDDAPLGAVAEAQKRAKTTAAAAKDVKSPGKKTEAPKAAEAPKKPATPSKKKQSMVIESDEDVDDDKDDVVVVTKKTEPKAKSPAKKKAHIEAQDDELRDEPRGKKPAAAPAAPVASSPAKAKTAPSPKKAAPKAATTPNKKSPNNKKKPLVVDDDDEEDFLDDDIMDDGSDADDVEVESKAKKAKSSASESASQKSASTPAGKKRPAPSPSKDKKGDDGDDKEKDKDKDKKKKFNYRSFMERAPPPRLGQKPIPEGKPFCLLDKVFILTGVLESLERADAEKLIKQYGGDVQKTPGKKVTHALVGNEPGPSKIKKIEELGVQILSEDDLLEMIRTLPERKPTKEYLQKTKKAEQLATEGRKQPEAVVKAVNLVPASTAPPGSMAAPAEVTEMWTVKYAPKSADTILANKAGVKKIQDWLKNWDMKIKNKSFKRAVLISGVPGIGKTTTANVLAREAGYEVLEFNASDARSKKKLKEVGFLEIGGNRSIGEFYTKDKADSNKAAAAPKTKKTLIIMDEVDGMGAGDRGGNQELCAMIKKTKVPVICICNDRQKSTVKTLANYCEDIRFQRPQAIDIAGRMKLIMEHEGFKHVDMEALKMLCASVNNDIRQILNMLQMLRLKTDRLDATPGSFQQSMAEGRHVELNPFFVVPQLFSGGSRSPSDSLEMFFHDYSLMPLFVQENYLSATPAVPKDVALERFALAADCISFGDLVNETLMRTQDWSLLSCLGMVSTVIPCAYTRGRAGKVDFPTWLGKNSNANKQKRLMKEIQVHMSAKTSGADKYCVRLDYIPALWQPLIKPLQTRGSEGVDDVLKIMDEYGLTKEDWETIYVVSGKEDLVTELESQTKSAFTRKYNKLPKKYAESITAKKGGGVSRVADNDVGLLDSEVVQELKDAEEDEEGGDSDGPDMKKDKMIKAVQPKKPAAKKASAKAAASGKAAAPKKSKK